MPTIPSCTADEARTALTKNTATVVDVLPPDYFAVRHIQGAVNACVYEVVFLDTLAAVAPDTGRPLIFYGAGEGSLDALDAAAKALAAGYTQVRVLEGGLDAWRAAAHPLAGSGDLTPEESLAAAVQQEPVVHYEVLPNESSLRWWGRNKNGGHEGRVAVQRGQMELAEGRLVRLDMAADMRAIANDDLEDRSLAEVLLAHLASIDFFHTAEHPQALFTSGSIRQQTPLSACAARYTVAGQLTVRGVSMPFEVLVVTELAAPDPETAPDENQATETQPRLVAECHFDFDRTDFGVLYGSGRFFRDLSYHLVFDRVSIALRLVARRV